MASTSSPSSGVCLTFASTPVANPTCQTWSAREALSPSPVHKSATCLRGAPMRETSLRVRRLVLSKRWRFIALRAPTMRLTNLGMSNALRHVSCQHPMIWPRAAVGGDSTLGYLLERFVLWLLLIRGNHAVVLKDFRRVSGSHADLQQ